MQAKRRAHNTSFKKSGHATAAQDQWIFLSVKRNQKRRCHIASGGDSLASCLDLRRMVISRTRSVADSKLGLRKRSKSGMPVSK